MEVRYTINDIFFAPLAAASPLEALKDALATGYEPIIDINTLQLDKGEDSEGGSIGRYKYFEYKGRFEPVDLLLTGAFRGSFYLDIDDTQTKIKATDSKTGKLTAKYGDDIFGIQEDNIPQVQNAILPDFQNNYENQFP